MRKQELEQEILDYIKNLYNAEYIGELIVTKEDVEDEFGEILDEFSNYILSMAIPSYMTPTIIAGEFSSDEDFLNYIYKEIRVRNYMRVYFYKVTRTNEQHEK